MTTTLSHIETECRLYALAREALASEVTTLNDEIEKLKRARLGRIKQLVARAGERHASLKAAIEEAPGLFVKPRTVQFHGIKAGYQKGKGGLAIADEDKTIEKIHDLYGDEATEYLHVTEKPDREALTKLPADALKKLGVHIVNATDEVLIKPTDSAVDKIVNALLKEATEEVTA